MEQEIDELLMNHCYIHFGFNVHGYYVVIDDTENHVKRVAYASDVEHAFYDAYTMYVTR